MKKLLMCVLTLLSVNLYAQEQKEVQALPELQEWYSWEGGFTGSYISYLPDFDSVGGGLHAITQGRDGDGVWYNRFPFDTLSQFRWKKEGSYAVYPVDFNNDGITEYFDTKGRVYWRNKKGEKPNPEPIIQLQRGGTINPLIGDLNGDGYEDILAYNDDKYFDIILGAKNLTEIKRETIQYPNATGNFYIGGYYTEKKEPRIIIYRDGTVTETFFLYGITVTNGEKPTVELKELDKIQKIKMNKDDVFYIPDASSVTSNYKESFNLFLATNADLTGTFYKLNDDKFTILFEEKGKWGTPFFLKNSVDNDIVPDYVRAQNGILYLFSGTPDVGKSPTAILPIKSSCGSISIQSINDVNNDGISDIVVGGSSGCFMVLLGNKPLLGVDNSTSNTFEISENIPNPIKINEKATIPLIVKTQGQYVVALYDINGVKIRDIFTGELYSGESKLVLDTHGLSIGFYVIRVNNSTQNLERRILIGE